MASCTTKAWPDSGYATTLCPRWDLSSCDERASVGAKHRSPLIPSQSRTGVRTDPGKKAAEPAPPPLLFFKKSRGPVHPWFTLVHSRFRRSVRGLPCQLLTTQPNVDATWGGGVRNVQQKRIPGNCHNREWLDLTGCGRNSNAIIFGETKSTLYEKFRLWF